MSGVGPSGSGVGLRGSSVGLRVSSVVGRGPGFGLRGTSVVLRLSSEIVRAHVCSPVTILYLVFLILLDIQKPIIIDGIGT